MPNPFLEQLDDESKSRLKASISEALAAGIPAETVAKYVNDNGERIFRRSTEQSALAVADPQGALIDTVLGFVEPNAMNAVALPLSFVTGPMGGRAVAGALGSRAVKRLAVQFLADPKKHTVLFNTARKAGLTETFGALVRIKEEPSFLVSLGRAVGFGLPFSTVDAVEAVNDERSPAGAFATSLSIFTAIDMILTRGLPGVGHHLAKAARKRVTEDFFATEALGERMSMAAIRGVSRGKASESPVQGLGVEVQEALGRMTLRDMNEILSSVGKAESIKTSLLTSKQKAAQAEAHEMLDALEAHIAGTNRLTNLNPEVQEALGRMTEADIRVIRRRGESEPGFVSFAQSVRRAHASLRQDDPRAAAAIEAAVDQGVATGMIDNSPTSLTIVSAIKGKPILVPQSVLPEVVPTSTGARPEAGKLADAVDAIDDPIDIEMDEILDRMISRGKRIEATGKRIDRNLAETLVNLVRVQLGLDHPAISAKIADARAAGVTPVFTDSEKAAIEEVTHAVRSKFTGRMWVQPERTADEIVNILEAAPVETAPIADAATTETLTLTRGSAVRVRRPDGSIVDATVEASMLGQAKVRLGTGKSVIVQSDDILRPLAVKPVVPLRPSAAIPKNDAEIFETELAAKIIKSGGEPIPFDPKIVSLLPESAQAFFPKQSLVGRGVVATEDVMVTPSGQAHGIKLVKGEQFIIGTEATVRREGFGRPRLDYRAHVYRIDPESNLPHIIRNVKLRDLNQHGLKLMDTPFGGSSAASAHTLADIAARQRVLLTSMSRTDAAKAFFQDAKAAAGANIEALIATTERIPFITKALIAKLKSNRGVRLVRKLNPAATVSKLEDVSTFEETLTQKSITRQTIEPHRAAEAEMDVAALNDYKRLNRIAEGVTPAKKSRLGELSAKGALSAEEEAERDTIRAAARGLTVAERSRLKAHRETFGPWENVEAAMTKVREETADEIAKANIDGPAVHEGRIESPKPETVLKRFRALGSDPESAADFIESLTDFTSVRGFEMQIDFIPDEAATGKNLDQLFSQFNLVYQGRVVRSYSPQTIDDMIRFIDRFDQNDPAIVEKILADLGDTGPRPSGGC